MCNKALAQEIDIYRQLGLIRIPLKPRAKEPLVRWGDGWNPTREELGQWFTNPRVNIGVRCGENLAVVDCDSEEAFRDFTATHDLPPGCPVVKTGRGYHIWVKPKRPLRSQLASGVEIKCLGSYVVAPPSIHPNGTHYIFVIPPIDLVELFDKLGVKLKRVGKEYMGLCPFHDDRQPSLSVNRDKGVWHCFGYGRGGDVHNFLEEWQSR